MRTPVGIDVGPAIQQERCNLKMPIHACPGQRYIQDVLRLGGSRMQIPQDGGTVGRVMPAEAPEPRMTGRIEPSLHSREIPSAGRMTEIIRQEARSGLTEE